MAESAIDAIEKLNNVFDEKSNRRKLVFNEYVQPFFSKADSAVGDTMKFFRDFRTILRELTSDKYRDEAKLISYLAEHRQTVESARAKMLNERIHLERQGNVIKSIVWVDDLKLQNAMRKLVDEVLIIIREYDGVGSRPNTLLDSLDLISVDRTVPEIFGIFGGMDPLISQAEHCWGNACQVYEQIRVYVTHGVYPTEWGAPPFTKTTYPNNIFLGLRAIFWRTIKIVLVFISLAVTIAAVVNSLGEQLKSQFHRLIQP